MPSAPPKAQSLRTPPTPRHHAGFTWLELIVCLGVIAVLASLVLPAINGTTCGGNQMTQILSNMKQLHLATQQMALDGLSTDNTNLGWPGDIGGTFTNWAAKLVPEYLSTNDFCKLLSAPGRIVPTNNLPLKMSDTALILYAVRSDSATNAVFLSTANFTNTPTGGILDPKAKPYGHRGFVVFQKGGEGRILHTNQVGDTKAIGSFVPLCR